MSKFYVQEVEPEYEHGCLSESEPEAPPEAIPLKHELTKAEMSRGGRIGGKKRLISLTPERRREIASKAAQTMWARKRAKCSS